MIRLLICDDHRLIAEGMELMLDQESEIEVAQIVESGREAIEFLQSNTVDILILDLSMPEMTGLEVLEALERLQLKVKTLILTMHDQEELIQRVVKKNIQGYVFKNTNQEKLIHAIQQIAKGYTFFDEEVLRILMNKNHQNKNELTPREKDIMKLLVEGKKVKEIADLRFISTNTVLSHKKNIYSKLNVHSVAELIHYAHNRGL
jgi:DNA-binding NarL/FixJ family response regulator